MRGLAAWLVMAGAAWAQPVPGFEDAPEPLFFEGLYALVGVDSAGRALNAPVRLEVVLQGLELRGCDLGAGRLDYARIGEAFVLAGRMGGEALWCRFSVDPGNYPLLNCANPDGLRLTLWPEGEFGAPLVCG